MSVNCVKAGRIEETVKKTFDANSDVEIVLRNKNGSVVVSSWDKPQVLVIAEKVVKAHHEEKAQKIMEQVEIIFNASPERIEIESDYPPSNRSHNSFWGLFFDEANAQISISYQLTVPKDANLELKTTNGSITIENTSGNINARSTNGSVKLLDVHGMIRARTTNGRIQAEVLEFTREDEIYFKTTNGSIKLDLPTNIQADVRANTTNGSISTDFPLEVSGKFNRKNLRGTINGGGGRIDLTTTNGSIKINEN